MLPPKIRALLHSEVAAILDKVTIENGLTVRKTARDLVEVDMVAQVETAGIVVTLEAHNNGRVPASRATNQAMLTTKTDRGKDRSQLRPSASKVSFSKTTRIRRAFQMLLQAVHLKESVHSPSS